MSGTSTKVATVVGVFNASGHVNLRDTYFDAGQAATLRHQIWPRIMSVANAKYGGAEFPSPPDSALRSVQTEVPNVVGLSLEAAQQALEEAGFGFENAGEQDSNLPPGTVSGQDPSGMAGRGTTVRVFTSNGQGTTVPDLTGMTAQQAKSALDQAGLKMKAPGNTTPVSVVQSQNPPAGTAVKRGTEVSVTFSNVPGPGGAAPDGGD
jgi:hypothetical protein